MDADRRRQILLGGLLLILAIVVYRSWFATSTSLPAASNRAASRSADTRRSPAGVVEAPDVHLEALGAERPKPADAARNLFRFKPKPIPAPPVPAPVERPAAVPAAPPLPSGPAPPPPITLKFIGIVEVPGKSARFAILSDGRGLPMQGKEGDIIEGRYRILKIGAESIEMAYLDGRGRQTIRLSGG